MAGAGYKLFNTGDVLTAAQVNTYLQEQSVMVFANAAARTSALSGVLAEGMISYLKDTDAVEKYNGTSWIAMQPGDIEGVTATSPLTGGGTSGTVTIGIQDASTSQKGAVQLSDSITTTSSTLAATSTAVKAAAEISNNLTMVQQYTATESVLKNIPSRVPAAEQLLKQAVYWIDAAQADNSDQVLDNQGWAAPALTTQLGSSASADSNDPKFLDFDGTNYVYLPSGILNGLQVTSSSAINVTGDLDIRVRMAADDWTSENLFFHKWNDSSSSWYFQILPSGNFRLRWTPDGTTGAAILKDSTAANTIPDGSVKWVRATLDVDNGASGNDVKFWTSDDAVTWTQLGSTITTAGVTSVFAGTSPLNVGGYAAGGFSAGTTNAKIYSAQILNGIDGTKLLDINTSVIGSGSATSFNALTGQTVTINRATGGKKSSVVTHPVWLFGTDDYMEVADNDFIDFAGTDSFTLIAIQRQWATFGTNDAILAKKANTTLATAGYLFGDDGTTAAIARLQIGDGAAGTEAVSGSRVGGTLNTLAAVRDVNADNLIVYLNGTAGSSVTDTTTTSLSNSEVFRIGRLSGAGTEYNDMELVAAAIFRRALTASEISTITNYYNARVGI